MTEATDFKARQKRGLRKAKVEVHDLNIISPDMEFVATHEGQKTQTFTPIPGEEGGLSGKSAATSAGVVRHTRPDTVVMYKPDGMGHYSPRTVPVTAIRQNLESGFRSVCPECGGHHSGNPNDCPGREPVAVRRCPVCRKRVYDNMALVSVEQEPEAREDYEIRDESYATSTPASRTKAQLDLHIWAFHPQSARIMNIAPLPQPPESMIDALSAVGANA